MTREISEVFRDYYFVSPCDEIDIIDVVISLSKSKKKISIKHANFSRENRRDILFEV